MDKNEAISDMKALGNRFDEIKLISCTDARYLYMATVKKEFHIIEYQDFGDGNWVFHDIIFDDIDRCRDLETLSKFILTALEKE